MLMGIDHTVEPATHVARERMAFDIKLLQTTLKVTKPTLEENAQAKKRNRIHRAARKQWVTATTPFIRVKRGKEFDDLKACGVKKMKTVGEVPEVAKVAKEVRFDGSRKKLLKEAAKKAMDADLVAVGGWDKEVIPSEEIWSMQPSKVEEGRQMTVTADTDTTMSKKRPLPDYEDEDFGHCASAPSEESKAAIIRRKKQTVSSSSSSDVPKNHGKKRTVPKNSSMRVKLDQQVECNDETEEDEEEDEEEAEVDDGCPISATCRSIHPRLVFPNRKN
ncbi:uncharacterized protein BYT42DRAFT_642070 [Radiomyces spectabilis]|uniref:uncharacterized protein n=1 Tax=Radiomyces spectabilis TaxID=64574 RepID=UPI0022203061|nr:uncharacterized protein BYT42DRAFT_642070 [Radiomyces spectabilis]KAI8391636.1 hypothetical protein BYT42DRAFT_642070 [Radiomyces spectabilis]